MYWLHLKTAFTVNSKRYWLWVVKQSMPIYNTVGQLFSINLHVFLSCFCLLQDMWWLEWEIKVDCSIAFWLSLFWAVVNAQVVQGSKPWQSALGEIYHDISNINISIIGNLYTLNENICQKYRNLIIIRALDRYAMAIITLSMKNACWRYNFISNFKFNSLFFPDISPHRHFFTIFG